MRGLGWNPELLGPVWATLETLEFGASVVSGEAALAGYWLHHRLVEQVEILAPDQAGLEALRAQFPGAASLLELPGFVRLGWQGVELGLALESSPALEPGPTEKVPPLSLRDLAVDRWLRVFTPTSRPMALIDLYFLSRARVDLRRAAREMSRKDLGASQRALAVVLHEYEVAELPRSLVRPLSRQALEEFRQEWVEALGIEAFS